MADQPPALVAAIWRRFDETGDWPTVQRVQSDLPEHDVRLAAREVGRDLVECGWGSGDRCKLKLRGIALCPEAEQLVTDFIRAVRLLAARYIEDQMFVVQGSMVAAALELDEASHARLARVMWSNLSGMSMRGDIADLSYEVVLTPSVVAFRSITDLEGYFAEAARAYEEEAEAARREHAPLLAPRAEPVVVDPGPLESPPQLSDPELSSMLHEDLEELLRLRSARAWKATALLAGSCIEAALLDLWMARPTEAKEALGPKWRQSSAFKMAQAALERGWVDADHAPLLEFIRHWRNTVHPALAVQKQQPNRQLAEMLIALLAYLLEALHGGDTT